MSEIFGHFTKQGDAPAYLLINFLPNMLSIQQRWRNNGLSADFLADYWTSFFPGDDAASQHRQAEIRDAISYIANELLENAMKFSYDMSKYPVSIALYLFADEVRFYVTNSVASQCCGRLQNFIRELLSDDPDEMYLRQLERNAAEDRSGHLGFLTMLSDYETQLGWKFDPLPAHPEIVTVTTMVRLPAE